MTLLASEGWVSARLLIVVVSVLCSVVVVVLAVAWMVVVVRGSVGSRRKLLRDIFANGNAIRKMMQFCEEGAIHCCRKGGDFVDIITVHLRPLSPIS